MEALQQTNALVLEDQDLNTQIIDCMKKFRSECNITIDNLAGGMRFSKTLLAEIEDTCNITKEFAYKLYGLMLELKDDNSVLNTDQIPVVNELYEKLDTFIKST